MPTPYSATAAAAGSGVRAAATTRHAGGGAGGPGLLLLPPLPLLPLLPPLLQLPLLSRAHLISMTHCVRASPVCSEHGGVTITSHSCTVLLITTVRPHSYDAAFVACSSTGPVAGPLAVATVAAAPGGGSRRAGAAV
jgi:hypothetical protein